MIQAFSLKLSYSELLSKSKCWYLVALIAIALLDLLNSLQASTVISVLSIALSVSEQS